MRLTDPKVKSLKPKKSRYIVWEEGGTGLGVRVSPADRKSFIFMYRFDGKSRMLTIGPYPKVKLVSARLKVAQAKERLSQEIDPGQELIEAKEAVRGAHSIKALIDEYIEKWAKPRKRSWKEDERILRKDVQPVWGRKKAETIKRRDIVLLLDEIVDRGAPIQANRTLAVIRKMFNFALSRGILEQSPCVQIPAPAKENQRDRVLSENEIRSIWLSLDDAGMTKETQLALKLQLITGQRKGEIVGAEWRDIDLDNAWWTIPKEKAKNNLPHRVPLSPLALKLLKEIKDRPKGSSFLFPSPTKKESHITEPAIDRAIRNNRELFDIEHFVPHDLRRTVASQITAMGIPRLTVSKLLNHVESGITAVYDRHSYDKEKRTALNKWSKRLEQIVTKPQTKFSTSL
jgi:integrase